MSISTLPTRKKAQPKLLTIEQFLAQYGDRPADLIRGEIQEYAMPGGVHGNVCGNISDYLKNYLRKKNLGRVFINDTHVRITRNPDTARGMDVGYISYSRLPKNRVPVGVIEVVPELVFEVRSPSDRWVLILEKVINYLDLGVTAVVVLDPKTESATVFRHEDRQQTIDANQKLTLPDILPGFAVLVAKFFE